LKNESETDMDISDNESEGSNTRNAPAIVQLYINARRASKHATKGNQLEILSWYKYAESFEKKVNEILSNNRITLKTAKSIVYKEIHSHLSYVSLETLRQRTKKARTIYNFFKDIGVDKIERIRSF
ncbi:1570_t:CDS:2, partial [Scutellospora calospora]